MSTEKPTCGDCKHLKEWRPKSPKWGKCQALRGKGLPMWIRLNWNHDQYKNTLASDCECFERKDAK